MYQILCPSGTIPFIWHYSYHEGELRGILHHSKLALMEAIKIIDQQTNELDRLVRENDKITRGLNASEGGKCD